LRQVFTFEATINLTRESDKDNGTLKNGAQPLSRVNFSGYV